MRSPYIQVLKNALQKSYEQGTRNKELTPYKATFRLSDIQAFRLKNIFSFFHFFIFSFLLISCTESGYTPKPTGYPRIDLPKKEYTDFNSACPFSFRVPKYANVQPDKEKGSEACWYNIDYPQFNAKIHMSYKPVSSFKNFYEMSEDAHTFAYKHTVKAEDIYDSAFYFKPNHTSGYLFSIEGNTASAIQFYATDSSKHYLRGALYFNTKPNKDSLQPVVNFIRADIDTLLKSLRWR
jgi:gliding motility-associated lipoprotein GldD